MKKIFIFILTGLSFRPQAKLNLKDVQALISLSINNGGRRKRSNNDNIETYVKDLDEFFKVCK